MGTSGVQSLISEPGSLQSLERCRAVFVSICKGALYLVALIVVPFSEASAQTLKETVLSGDVEAAGRLLETGIDVNEVCVGACTAIYLTNDPEMVKVLIEHGADVDFRDGLLSPTPIENAAYEYHRCNKEEIRLKWKETVNVLRQAGGRYSPVAAIRLGDIDHIRSELQKGSIRLNDAPLPLVESIECGDLKITALLLENGADPAQIEPWNLKYVVSSPEMLTLLMRFHLDVKQRTSFQGGRTGYWIGGESGTLLQAAVENASLESVKILIDAGLDPNSTDENGSTALHLAILSVANEPANTPWHDRHVPMIQYLLEHGASLTFRDRKGRTPARLARRLGCSLEIQQLLHDGIITRRTRSAEEK